MEIPNDIEGLRGLVIQLLERVEKLESENAQLRLENAQLRAEIAQLKAENARLKLENAELREKLKLKSHNSGKPPSSDGLAKKSIVPKPKGNNQGGQFGHQGKTLKRSEKPDQIIIHHAAKCRCCGREFSLSEVEQITASRQVFEIPEPKIEVIEHQVGVISCCGEQHYGAFPRGVKKAAQYGERIKSLAVMLNVEHRLPIAQVKKILNQLYGSSFNQSTVLNAMRECFAGLAPLEKRIKSEIIESETVHFDETGVRVEGKLKWMHVASNELWTHLFVHQKRGGEALRSEPSVLKDYRGRAVHDCYSSYFQFEKVEHILCNAHLLRELERLKESGSEWGKLMQRLILRMYEISQRGQAELKHRARWERLYENICEMGEREEPPPRKGNKGREKSSFGRNLLNRLRKYRDSILEYAFCAEVPFTNKQAERDLRNVKVKQKICNSFRQAEGAEVYARIQGFVSTLKKQKMNILQELVNVFQQRDITFSDAR
jgi:transposase